MRGSSTTISSLLFFNNVLFFKSRSTGNIMKLLRVDTV